MSTQLRYGHPTAVTADDDPTGVFVARSTNEAIKRTAKAASQKLV